MGRSKYSGDEARPTFEAGATSTKQGKKKKARSPNAGDPTHKDSPGHAEYMEQRRRFDNKKSGARQAERMVPKD
jgi:hypothetical protein